VFWFCNPLIWLHPSKLRSLFLQQTGSNILFKPIFHEWDAFAFKEGRKLPKAFYQSMPVFYLICLFNGDVYSTASTTHSVKSTFFTWACGWQTTGKRKRYGYPTGFFMLIMVDIYHTNLKFTCDYINQIIDQNLQNR
jgi:hypothetical protein